MLPSRRCSPFTVEALVLRGLWDKMRERSRRGKRSIWLLFSPEWDGGVVPGQALGAVAVSADRAAPHVALETNTASY